MSNQNFLTKQQQIFGTQHFKDQYLDPNLFELKQFDTQISTGSNGLYRPNFFQMQVLSLTKQISVPRMRYFDLKCC